MKSSLVHLLGAFGALIVGTLLLFLVKGLVSADESLGHEPSAVHATKTGPNSASISLGAYSDSGPCHGKDGGPKPDWVSYCPSTTIDLPANSVITVTIRQYDSGSPLHNNFFQRVVGTLGGVEKIDGKTVKGLNGSISQIAHTFTIQSAPDSPQPLFVSVPVASVADTAPTAAANCTSNCSGKRVMIGGKPYAKPRVVVFKFRTGPPGHYVWKCYDPCGQRLSGDNAAFGGPMATIGYMAGQVNVT